MGEYLDQVPEEIQDHIREITRTSGLPEGEESVEKISQGWLEKRRAFEDQVQSMDMEEVDTLEKEDERGALAFTYSGSLVNIGPLVEGGRKVQYVSIGMRSDVPDTAEKEESRLAKEVTIGEKIEFEVGPVRTTSPIHKIAILKGEPSAQEQEEKISQATQILQEDFVEVNKTLMGEGE